MTENLSITNVSDTNSSPMTLQLNLLPDEWMLMELNPPPQTSYTYTLWNYTDVYREPGNNKLFVVKDNGFGNF